MRKVREDTKIVRRLERRSKKSLILYPTVSTRLESRECSVLTSVESPVKTMDSISAVTLARASSMKGTCFATELIERRGSNWPFGPSSSDTIGRA
jgi:hypothetical protein